ncbi:hypothetical protein GCM10007907_00650 [Chitinimonas prasina]|uniref:HTH araC/xylS-type domain-containing protein n=1 Tax=Chitinimonas prasina TaxID=1434937 RepID=A0ABQ5YD58_9NEIS|nr:helix-turn-helix transcriptional regulator [Chitinimonas prasina]GLR11275.1 hypothetical protein GCM10007907_00650 [Chitinimonas prasina]
MYLWRGRALVLGVDSDSTPHAHHALQLSLALEGTFRLSLPDGSTRMATADLFLPGQPHRLAANGALMAHLFIDPGQRSLADWRRDEIPAALPADLLAALRAAWHAPLALSACEPLVAQWQDAWLPGFDRAPVLDSRIAQALALLAEEGELTAEYLADTLQLSQSRFSHLFSQHTGLPFRRYVLWMRLLAAVAQLGRGGNLTTAAHAAGFADLAHMSRVFHATFGVVPSTLSRVAIVAA